MILHFFCGVSLARHKSVLFGIEKITGRKPKLYIGDIQDRMTLKTIFTANNVENLMHFTGLKSVAESEKEPLGYFANNVSGSIVLYEEALKAGVKRLIFSPSATVYGQAFSVK